MYMLSESKGRGSNLIGDICLDPHVVPNGLCFVFVCLRVKP